MLKKTTLLLLLSLSLQSNDQTVLLKELKEDLYQSIQKFGQKKKENTDSKMLQKLILEAKEKVNSLSLNDKTLMEDVLNSDYHKYMIKQIQDLENRFQKTVKRELNKPEKPFANIREDDTFYYYEIFLPGISKENITLTIKNNLLIISGEGKTKQEIKNKNYHEIEQHYGKFYRSFSLPNDANLDTNQTQAISKNGILEIQIAKKKEQPSKNILIK